MGFPLDWLLLNKWLWIIILSLSAIMIMPFIVIQLILTLPPELRGVAMITIIVGWGTVSGYKDWAISKRKEEKFKLQTYRNTYEEI